MSNPLLSISVAAYNVEDYLENTLNSFILDESIMGRFEVIIVNDGSKDRTVEIAKLFVEKYPNTFILVDKENGGYGSTINASLPLARGKYFRLLDGDDWINKEGFVDYLIKLETIDSDLVLTKYCEVNEQTNKKRVVKDTIPYSFQEKNIKDLKLSINLAMHQMTYKTELLRINKISITEKCYYTDFEFIVKPFPFVNTVTCVDAVVYMYRIGREGQSVQISSWHKNIHQGIKVTLNLSEYYEKVKLLPYAQNLEFVKSMIISSIQSKYRVVLTMPRERKPKKIIKNFDKRLKSISEDLYYEAVKQNSKRYRLGINLLRKTNFLLFGIESVIFKRRLKSAERLNV
jgi:glycosyltransferase involved in cell wall biosynthesis